MTAVLVIGFDPAAIPGVDTEAINEAVARGQAHFETMGIEADLCTVSLDDTAEGKIVYALTSKDYECVVIGGGIRQPEPLLEFFENVVNLIRQHAPTAAIAFNTGPEDSADAAARWLR